MNPDISSKLRAALNEHIPFKRTYMYVVPLLFDEDNDTDPLAYYASIQPCSLEQSIELVWNVIQDMHDAKITESADRFAFIVTNGDFIIIYYSAIYSKSPDTDLICCLANEAAANYSLKYSAPIAGKDLRIVFNDSSGIKPLLNLIALCHKTITKAPVRFMEGEDISSFIKDVGRMLQISTWLLIRETMQ